MKSYFSLSLKLLTSICLTLIFLEIGLRLFPGVIPLDMLVLFNQKPRSEIAQRLGLPTQQETVPLDRDDGGPELRLHQPFAKLSYRPKNDVTIQVTMDEIGFCNPKGNYSQPAIELMTIGDSFTTCFGVTPQETWTAQLGMLSGYSDYNLGLGGVGIQEYLQIFKKFGPQKSPQVVIMNIYGGNDLSDARKYYRYTQGERKEKSPDSSQESTQESILKSYSYGVNLIAAIVEYSRGLDSLPVGQPSELSENFRFQLIFPGGISVPFRAMNNQEVKQARELYTKQTEIGVYFAIEESLRTFVELGKKYNFVPVVTYIPAASTAYEAHVVYENPEFKELMPWFSREQRGFLKEQGGNLGYHFVDLTPAIQAAAQSYGPDKLLYFQEDIHLTAAGHAVVANTLNQTLQELGIIHKKPPLD